MADILASGWQGNDTLNHADGPAHDFHASLVRPFVGPRRVRALTEKVQRIVDEFVAELPSDTVVDLIADFAEGLAISVMCEFVGVPRQDRAVWARGADGEMALLGAVLDEQAAIRYATDYVQMQNRIAELLNERMESPCDDLLTAVATAHPPEGISPLTMGEMIRIITATVVAGNETTRAVIATAMRRICCDPGLEARTRASEEAVSTLVEETLRIEPPGIMIFRVATKDTILRGVKIAKNEMVGVVLASANHDPDVFERPYMFDLDRENPKRHLAFGSGSHSCLGAPLARLEAAVAIRTLLSTFDRIELSPGPPPKYFPAFMIRSMLSLPLIMHRAVPDCTP